MAGDGLRHGSLFSGIGGFDLAAQWCGWRNVFHCEINEFCNHVLNFYWPEAASIKNIIGYEWKKWKGKVDVLSGGFPCQPYSSAGKQLGKADPRHLWPAMLGAVKAIQPDWVVGENVRGLVGWNGGVVFNEVQADLEAAGYEVLPFLLPAAGVNAPHRRERIWFIAHRAGLGRNKKRGNSNRECESEAVRPDIFSGADGHAEVRFTTDANDRQQQEQPERSAEDRRAPSASRRITGTGTDIGDRSGNTPEGVRQLGTGPRLLQKTVAEPGGFGCDHRGDHRQERPVLHDQRPAEKDQSEWQKRQRGFREAGLFSADTGSKGLERKTSQRIQTGTRGTDGNDDAEPAWFSRIPGWENFPQTQPAVRIGDDGLPDPLDFDTVFEGIPFPVKPITFSKWRTESIKAYGNAIVPQVAWQLFSVIQRMSGLKQPKQ